MTEHQLAESQGSKPPIPRHRRLMVGFAVSLGVALVASASVLGYVGHTYAAAVPAHVLVAGVDLGGLDKTAATAKLQAAVDAANVTAITLTVNGTTLSRAPGDLKVSYDVPATVTQALAVGRTSQAVVTAWHQLTRLFGQPLSVPLQVSYDQSALASAVTELSMKLGTPTTDAHLVVDARGGFSISATKAGQAIEVAPLAAQLTDKLRTLALDRSITGQLTAREPSVSTTDATELVPKLSTLLASPVTLTVPGGVTTTVNAKTLAGWVSFAPTDPALDPTLTLATAGRADGQPGSVAALVNKDAVAGYVKTLAGSVDQPAVDAKLTISNGRAAVFQASQNGRSVKQADAVTTIASALATRAQQAGEKPLDSARDKPLAITLPVDTTTAAITDSTISSLGINQLIGKGTTDFSGSPTNRVHNIDVGRKALNGVIIKPGDEFSTVQTLGAIDASTGYLPELVILDNKILPQYGGGLCQVSTTLFRAVLNAGLPVTERAPHSMQVIYYQRGVGPGLDATVYDPKPDFRFRNDTPGSILIQSYIDGNNLTFELYGTSDGRVSTIDGPHTLATTAPPDDQYQHDDSLQPGEKKVLEHAVPGATTIATYTVTRNGQQINQQVFKSAYAAMPNIYAVGPDQPAN